VGVLSGQRGFDHGMAPAFDVKVDALVHERACVSRRCSKFAQCACHIDHRKRVGDGVQLGCLLDHVRAHLVEEFALDGERLFGRLRDATGKRGELVGREAHRAADRLAVAEEFAVAAGLQLVRHAAASLR
jgi:hypothetical protein